MAEEKFETHERCDVLQPCFFFVNKKRQRILYIILANVAFIDICLDFTNYRVCRQKGCNQVENARLSVDFRLHMRQFVGSFVQQFPLDGKYISVRNANSNQHILFDV